MLTHAASCFSTSISASFSATARSGTLVNTKSLLIPQSFVDRGVAQTIPEDVFQPAVIQPPRLVGEAFSVMRARGPGQAGSIGDEVQPVAELHLRVVGSVVDARRRIRLECAHDDACKV